MLPLSLSVEQQLLENNCNSEMLPAYIYPTPSHILPCISSMKVNLVSSKKLKKQIVKIKRIQLNHKQTGPHLIQKNC